MQTYKEIVREIFTFKLTEHELLAKGEEAGELHRDILDKEYKLSILKKERKAEIDKIRADFNHLMKIIDKKEEDRQVDVVKIFDFEKKMVSFVFSGEVLRERPMDNYETQIQFDPLKMNNIAPQL
jgi:hypothetical protein